MVIVSNLLRDTDTYWKINAYFNLRIFSRRALKHQRPLSRRLKLNCFSIITVNLLTVINCDSTISSLNDSSLYLKHISISFRAIRRYFKLKIHHNNHTFCNGRQLESHSNSSYYIKDIYFLFQASNAIRFPTTSNELPWRALGMHMMENGFYCNFHRYIYYLESFRMGLRLTLNLRKEDKCEIEHLKCGF